MQSVDEFTPSTTEPVFGSGLVSQTKSQQPSTNNDISDNEKVNPPSEPVVNGQNDVTVNKTIPSNDTITNGKSENVNENKIAEDLSAVHVNGQNEKPTVETNNDNKPVEEPVSTSAPTETEKSNEAEATVPSNEPEPVSSTPMDTGNEGSSTVEAARPPSPPAVEPATTTTEINDNVPEVPVATESETPEPKAKTPRGRAKAPVVSTTPTRQSTRGRKPASSSNAEENQATDDVTPTTTDQTETPQRGKRQPAETAKVVTPTNDQPNSTSDDNAVNDANKQDVVPSDGNENNESVEGQTEQATPTATGRKRGAPKSTPTSAKKPRGKNSITSTSDVDNEVSATEGEPVETPPKKARTSAPKKTPEPPSEEYVRKLRPRK